MEAGWLLLAMLAPWWVNLWGSQPFDPAKAALVRSIVGLLLGASLSVYLLNQHPHKFTALVAANPLLWPVVALAGILALATATGVDPALSLWGSAQRSQGLLTLLSYLAAAVVVSAWLRTTARLQRLLAAMAASAAVAAAIGILQWLGANPFPLVTDARSPVFSTLGRSNFLGDYLAMLTPVTLALLAAARQRRWRMALAGLLLVQLAVLGLAQARGAWLAAAVGSAVFGLLWAGGRLTPARRWIAACGVALTAGMAAGGPLLVLWLGPADGGSLAARLTIWRGVAALIGQRPWLGYGPESLALVFPRVFPPELVYYQGRQFFVDRAHNWLLDWTITAGLLGLLALMAVLAAFALAARRALGRARGLRQRALLAGAAAAVAAHFAGTLVSFDVTATATAAWLLMGAVAGQAIPPAAVSQAMLARAGPADGRWRPAPRHWALAAIALLAVGGSSLVINSRMVLADVLARQAGEHTAAARLDQAAGSAEQAIAFWPADPAYYHALAQVRQQQALTDPAQAAFRLGQAEAALLAARDLRPGEVGNWAALGELYALAGVQFGAPAWEAGRQSFAVAAQLAHNHATVFAAWGRLELLAGQPQQAAALLRLAVDLDATHSLGYLYLGYAELASSRVDEAHAAMQEAARLDPHHPLLQLLAQEIAAARE